MIINVKLLKMHPHTSQTFSMQENYSDELLGLDSSFKEPVRIDLQVENTGRVLVGKGTVQTVISLVCSRCLKEISYQINAPMQVTMAESYNSRQFEEAGEEFLEVDHNGDVDLSSCVREAILFNLPLIPLCRDDCQGICPGCGVDLNLAKCQCQPQEIDPRWQKLKDLK